MSAPKALSDPVLPDGLSAATLAVHADDHLALTTDVAPPIHTATTFDYAYDPDTLIVARERGQRMPDEYVYSRLKAPNSSRLEAVLSALMHAPAVTYSSGLSALFAAYAVLAPKRVAITGGYHGSHGVLAVHQRLSRGAAGKEYAGMEVHPLDVDPAVLQPGDVIHVETPVNPSGEARDLAHYRAIADARGCHLLVDATFGPPGLQDPFEQGADVVMHSATKYLGGHSDMLCGVLATRNKDWFTQLILDRLFMGSVLGSLEGWLGVRSVRTLELRVRQQSASAEKLARWLAGCVEGDAGQGEGAADVRRVVAAVTHASLQARQPGGDWVRRQMPGGFGPVFALTARHADFARRLPAKLRLFHHATSLGGVESLVEWRAMSDTTVEDTVLRFSVGVEAWEDLRQDLLDAFKALATEVDGKQAANGS